MSLKNEKYSPIKLLDLSGIQDYKGETRNASVGMGLDHLHHLVTATVDDVDPENDCDGLDVLAYHLSKYTCEQAIQDLKKVLERFNELK